MTPEQWLSVSVLLLVATNLSTVLYALYVRQQRDAAEGRPDGNTDREASDSLRYGPAVGVPGETDEAVTCTDCGAANDREYRYCRSCASQLPGVWLHGRTRADSGDRSVE